MLYPDTVLREVLTMALKFEEKKKEIIQEHKDPNGEVVGYTKPKIDKMAHESLKLVKNKP